VGFPPRLKKFSARVSSSSFGRAGRDGVIALVRATPRECFFFPLFPSFLSRPHHRESRSAPRSSNSGGFSSGEARTNAEDGKNNRQELSFPPFSIP